MNPYRSFSLVTVVFCKLPLIVLLVEKYAYTVVSRFSGILVNLLPLDVIF